MPQTTHGQDWMVTIPPVKKSDDWGMVYGIALPAVPKLGIFDVTSSVFGGLMENASLQRFI